jgi:hypothetical protein
MKMIKNIACLMIVLVISIMSFAQDKKVEMADVMRSNGRIYVVIAVVITILLGLILYVFRLDRKITKLEKETN